MLTCGRVECFQASRESCFTECTVPCLQGTGLSCSMVDVHAFGGRNKPHGFNSCRLSFALQEQTNGRPAATSLELVALLLDSKRRRHTNAGGWDIVSSARMYLCTLAEFWINDRSVFSIDSEVIWKNVLTHDRDYDIVRKHCLFVASSAISLVKILSKKCDFPWSSLSALANRGKSEAANFLLAEQQ